MATKSFVLSNGDGRVTFSNSGSNGVSIEDGATNSAVRGHVSASNLYINNSLVLRNVATSVTGAFISASAGLLTASATTLTGSVMSGALGWNGTTFVATNIVAKDYSGSVPVAPDSDLSGATSGSYKYDIHVKGVANVRSGSLPVKFGGTGLSGSTYYLNNNAILKASGSATSPTISVLSASTSVSGAILTSFNNEILMMRPGEPYVRYYNVPGTYTWKKPAGVTMARVICQGGGGGGGSGQVGAPTPAYRGGGGASGGFSDFTIFLTSSNDIIVTVGSGGAGGGANASNPAADFIVSSTPNGSRGGNGGISNFGNYISASGGQGGSCGNLTAGVAGSGYTFNGGNGAAYNANAPSVINNSSGGGSGGPATQYTPGTVTIAGIPNNTRNFGYLYDSTGKQIDITFGSGSVGSVSGSGPSRPVVPTSYGAGGGGGWVNAAISAGSGGPGAGGYVLVIAW